MVYIPIFASIAIVSLVSLVGVITLALNAKHLHKWLLVFVSFSAGTLLGDAFLHLLPEAVETYGFGIETSLAFLSAFLVFFILENGVKWHHHHHFADHADAHSFGYMNVFGDALHNFLDGIIIAGSYLVSVPLGIATTIAVILHEIPQEIGDFGVLLESGFSKKKAIAFNFGSALVAIIGGIVGIVFTSSIVGFSGFLLPFTAGAFTYIAATDLLPEVHDHKVMTVAVHLIAIILGIALMAGLLVFLE
jgi:zinc and cadmium transporter